MLFKVISFFVILATISVSIFGVFVFSFMHNMSAHLCPVSAVTGNGCPVSKDALALAIHHLSGLSSFMQTILPSLDWSLSLFLLTGLFSFLFIASLAKKAVFKRKFFLSKCYIACEFLFISFKNFLRWLVLHSQLSPRALYVGV